MNFYLCGTGMVAGGVGGWLGGTVAAGTPLPDNILVGCQSRVS